MLRILQKSPSTFRMISQNYTAVKMYSASAKTAEPAVEGTLLFDKVKSPAHGSYHWNTERALSVLTVPLIGTAMVYGSVPMVDIALGFVIPAHVHMGFDTIIQDYFPKRRSPVIHSIFIWMLRLGTALTLYGCYVINSRDVGLTALFGQLWTGKTAAGKKIE